MTKEGNDVVEREPGQTDRSIRSTTAHPTHDAAAGTGMTATQPPVAVPRYVGPEEDPYYYSLIRRVGGGGEGDVWEARYLPRQLNEPPRRAVKIFHPPADWKGAWPQPDDVKRWESLRLLLADWPIDNLVRPQKFFYGRRTYDSGALLPPDADEWVFCAVMDWVDGEDLPDVIASRPATRENVGTRVGYIRDVATVVRAFHSRTLSQGNPVQDCDIKPDNCMLRASDGRVVVIDITSMRLVDDPRESFGWLTRLYAAPEARTDPRARRSPAVDVYSLGGLGVYCLLGGAVELGEDGTGGPVTWTSFTRDQSALRERLVSLGEDLGVADPAAFAETVLEPLAYDAHERPNNVEMWADRLAALAVPGLSATPEPAVAGAGSAGSEPAPGPAATPEASVPVPEHGLAADRAGARRADHAHPERHGIAARDGTGTPGSRPGTRPAGPVSLTNRERDAERRSLTWRWMNRYGPALLALLGVVGIITALLLPRRDAGTAPPQAVFGEINEPAAGSRVLDCVVLSGRAMRESGRDLFLVESHEVNGRVETWPIPLAVQPEEGSPGGWRGSANVADATAGEPIVVHLYAVERGKVPVTRAEFDEFQVTAPRHLARTILTRAAGDSHRACQGDTPPAARTPSRTAPATGSASGRPEAG